MEDNQKDLNERRVPKIWQDLYLEMLANPMDDKTDKQFCEDIGISISALQQWKARYRKSIYAEVQKRRNAYINELRAMAYKALGQKMNKDTNALKLALQITGDLVERSESRVEMNDSEKLRRIEALDRSTKSRKKAWESASTGDSSPSSEGPGPESL